MQDWTKVVTEPLGLAGFALFLVFGAVSRLKRKKDLQWLGPVAAGMAVLALAGGLTLAYVKTARQAAPVVTPPPAAAPAQTQTNQQVQQTTKGAGSPIVQGVQGDVTITVDQSNGGTKKTPAAKKTDKSQ